MKTVTLWCEAGSHEWERKSQRGRRPTNCPEHNTAVALSDPPAEVVSAIRAATVERDERRQVRRTEAVHAELAALSATKRTAVAEWSEVFDRANKAKSKDDIRKLFTQADVLQERVLGVSRKMRSLETA